MIDEIQTIVAKASNANEGRCLLREYLQARILETLQTQGAFENWAFVGGTALRFLYDMPRFSEDLDFSLTHTKTDPHFLDHLKRIKTMLVSEGIDAEIKSRTSGAVQMAMVKCSGLLREAGLSPLASEKISIKVEIDTNPPAGAKLETSIVRRHRLLHILHYDKASLFAGKLHALLTRSYTKGRDVYDLLWYLSDRKWPEPNLIFLNNALRQTNWDGEAIGKETWRQQLRERVISLDWPAVLADVRPFIERPNELAMLTKESLLNLLQA